MPHPPFDSVTGRWAGLKSIEVRRARFGPEYYRAIGSLPWKRGEKKPRRPRHTKLTEISPKLTRFRAADELPDQEAIVDAMEASRVKE